MDIVKLLGARFLRPLFAVFLLVGLSRAAGAQAQDPAAEAPVQGQPDQSQKQNQDQNQDQADKSVRPTQD